MTSDYFVADKNAVGAGFDPFETKGVDVFDFFCMMIGIFDGGTAAVTDHKQDRRTDSSEVLFELGGRLPDVTFKATTQKTWRGTTPLAHDAVHRKQYQQLQLIFF
jgi:hypothetical protein